MKSKRHGIRGDPFCMKWKTRIGFCNVRGTIEDEIRSTRKPWNEVKEIAGDHDAWKLFMDALCSTRSKRT